MLSFLCVSCAVLSLSPGVKSNEYLQLINKQVKEGIFSTAVTKGHVTADLVDTARHVKDKNKIKG